MSDAAAPVACVTVPARDEAERIGACLRALAAQRAPGPVEVVLVLDRCRDETAAVAATTARNHGLHLHTIDGPGLGPGPARAAGMDVAARRLIAAGRPHALLATTDADTRVAPDWIARQLAHLATGARAIAGWIELDPAEAALLPPGLLARRRALAQTRLARVRRREPRAEHHHFGGASIGVTAAVYAAVGGIEPRPLLEDDAFAERLRRHGVPIVRPLDVRVTTSARTDGRAARGLARDLATLCGSATAPER
ncbi:glycosyltransferase [Conexibacter stalactiti]|uniref:Glycosyltransferase n=1 Tax=Conexibacter stalactiti TaxID=1940611 RepID=A0ABU4HVE4_9ACTN|nr:glycosyltransferase [Conexibacter stalactiti]MDW5597193.1 glycosyltransferase [Conexibacter stalactiti]MEC5037835.1 glycosyltransferase [Conexibacter stalactiti]